MRTHQIVLLPGDGIGPEITCVTRQILKRISKKHAFILELNEQPFGGNAIESYGVPLPQKTLEACLGCDAVLLAAIGDPKYDSLSRELRPESGLLKLRESLGLFANIRPVSIIPALISSSSLKEEVIRGVDLTVVRELTGGIYFGKPKGIIKTDNDERAFNTMSYSINEIDRIAEVAFNLAKSRRKKLCSVDKANVLEVSQLWRERVNKMSKDYSEVEISHLYVDNAAMQLVKNPKQFDVILTGNLFGDILSDEAAMLTGSIGMLPSASLSQNGPGLYEPIHGSAPDIANQNKANPIAMVLSAAMMLRIGLKEEEAAEDIERVVKEVLEEGFRTTEMSQNPSKTLGCEEMGVELLQKI